MTKPVDLTSPITVKLSVGETSVRVHLNPTNGPASGSETVEIQPADGSSIYDGAADAMNETERSNVLSLHGLTSSSA